MSAIDAHTIRALLNAGYAPTTICVTLDIPMDEITPLLSEDERRTQLRDDAMLRDAMRVLASRVIEEALRVMDEGTPNDKMTLITKFGGQMSRVLGQQEADSMKELREDVAAMMSEMRQGALGGGDGPDPDGEPTEDQDERTHS